MERDSLDWQLWEWLPDILESIELGEFEVSNVSIEIKEDGLYRVQTVFDKPITSKVFPGWHILFLDEQGVKRMGYICRINTILSMLEVVDVVSCPNTPPSVLVPTENVPWSRVLMAQRGYNRPKDVIYERTKKIGSAREVFMIGEDSTVGFIARKQSEHGRVYVDKINDNWYIR